MIRHWFYVEQNGMTVAKGVCPTRTEAVREANHYALMYSQDGPVTIKYRKVSPRRKS